MFSEQVCSFNEGDHFTLEPNFIIIVGKKHLCENREAEVDKEDQEDKRESHCGHSNKKVISLSHFSRKWLSSAFQKSFHIKHHAYTSSLLPSSDNKIKTGDKSGINNYTPFKFNIHNFRCFSSFSHCIGSSQWDINNSIREIANRK